MQYRDPPAVKEENQNKLQREREREITSIDVANKLLLFLQRLNSKIASTKSDYRSQIVLKKNKTKQNKQTNTEGEAKNLWREIDLNIVKFSKARLALRVYHHYCSYHLLSLSQFSALLLTAIS